MISSLRLANNQYLDRATTHFAQDIPTTSSSPSGLGNEFEIVNPALGFQSGFEQSEIQNCLPYIDPRSESQDYGELGIDKSESVTSASTNSVLEVADCNPQTPLGITSELQGHRRDSTPVIVRQQSSFSIQKKRRSSQPATFLTASQRASLLSPCPHLVQEEDASADTEIESERLAEVGAGMDTETGESAAPMDVEVESAEQAPTELQVTRLLQQSDTCPPQSATFDNTCILSGGSELTQALLTQYDQPTFTSIIRGFW